MLSIPGDEYRFPLGFSLGGFSHRDSVPDDVARLQGEGTAFDNLKAKEAGGPLSDAERQQLERLSGQYKRVNFMPPPNGGSTN